MKEKDPNYIESDFLNHGGILKDNFPTPLDVLLIDSLMFCVKWLLRYGKLVKMFFFTCKGEILYSAP